MNRNRTRPDARFPLLIIGACILLLAFWLRIVNLYALPVFVDEGNHIVWAQRWASGNHEYPWLMDGRMIAIMWIGLFQPLGPAPLWVARAATGLLSVLGIAASIAVGKRIHSNKAGLLAGLVCALLPYTVFHDRQVLANPIMASLGAVAVALALRLVTSQRRWLMVPFAFALAASTLANLFGFTNGLFAALFGLALWFQSRQKGLAAIAYVVLAGVVSLVLMALAILVFWPQLGDAGNLLARQEVGFVGCPALLCQGDLGKQLTNLATAWEQVRGFAPSYFGWGTLLLAGLAWPLTASNRRPFIAALAIGTALIFSGLMLGVGTGAAIALPARYVAMLAMPISVLSASAVCDLPSFINERILRWSNRAITWAASIVIILVCFTTAWANSAAFLLNPVKAQWAAFEHWEYLSGHYGSLQIELAVRYIQQREEGDSWPPVVIVNGPVHMVGAYFDRARVDVRTTSELMPIEFGTWLRRRQNVYLIDEAPSGTPVEPCALDYGVSCTELVRIPNPDYWTKDSIFRVRLVTAADATLRPQIYADLFPRPEKLSAEYETLVAGLPADTPLNLLVYPPNHAATLKSLLESKTNITVTPIGDSWPLDIAAAEDQLQTITASHSNVQVVLVEETKGDPERHIETWLKTHLFVIGEQWFGPVRLINFAGDGPIDQTLPVNGHFGETIKLESVELLDSSAQPGGVVRLRLNWVANAVIPSPYKVFTHIFAGDTIIAQHDGQPVGELRPTNTWQTGEIIHDQFAIQLPVDAPPGVYQLRIGIDDIETQARLPVLFADGASGEFFTGGTITIQ